MKKDRFSYMFVDPSVDGYSASRAGSVWIILLDTVWVVAAICGWPPEQALVPISSMLGICTGAVWASYAGNSFARSWRTVGDVASTVLKQTTMVTDSGGRDEKTTTVTSREDSSPGDDGPPRPPRAKPAA